MLIVSKKSMNIPLCTFLLSSNFLLPVNAGQINIQLENDGIFANDNNYTNGFSLGWESKPQRSVQNRSSSNKPLLLQLQHSFKLPIAHTHSVVV